MCQQEASLFFGLLDKYLITDLEVMVREIPPRDAGGLGYPIMHSILAGMELLGFVLSGDKYNQNKKKDEKRFFYFWVEFFEKFNPKYKGLKKVFRYCVRNGTAHLFVAKFGISLSKENKDHLKITKDNNLNMLNIDVVSFFEDFAETYSKVKEELLQKRNPDLINNFKKGYNNLIKDLQVSRKTIDNYIRNLPKSTKMMLGISKEFTNRSISTQLSSPFVTTTNKIETTKSSLPENLINKQG